MAGDIAEETQDAGRRIPRTMRLALIWGGITSIVLTGALLLAMPRHDPVGATVTGGGVPFILGQLCREQLLHDESGVNSNWISQLG